MPDNGSGTYTLVRSMSADDAAGIKIVSTNFDAQHDDIADALNNRVCRDGQNSPSANLPMAGYKHTNVNDAAALNQYITMGQAQRSVHVYASASASANEIKLACQVTCSSLTKGQTIVFIATSTNTGAVTIAVDDVTAVAAKKAGNALTSGDIVSGTAYLLTYDGTAFQLHNVHGSATPDRAGVIEIATTAEVTAGTDDSRAVTPSTLSKALGAGSDAVFANLSASALTITNHISASAMTVTGKVSAGSDVVAGGNFVGASNKLIMGVVEYTSSHTMGSADEGKYIIMTSAASCKLAIPSSATTPIPVGAGCIFTQRGAGEVRVSANVGVTINKEVGLRCNAQHAVGGIMKTSADAWSAFGSLKA